MRNPQISRRRRFLALAWLALPCLATSSIAFGAGLDRVITRDELRSLNTEAITSINRAASDTTATAARSVADLASEADRVITDLADPRLADGIRLQPGEYVATRATDPVREIGCSRANNGQCIQTPFRVLTVDSDGRNLDLALDVETQDALRYQPDTRRYQASLFLKLSDAGSAGRDRALAGPIGVLVSGEIDDVIPAEIVQIERTNTFVPVELVVLAPAAKTEVRLAPEDGNLEPQALMLDVRRPTLKVTVKEAILGFGLETASVTVSLPGVAPHPSGQIHVLSRGSLLNDGLTLTEHGSATTVIRSRATGPDTITATLEPFANGEATITYLFPWSWLGAVLAGAVLGIAMRLVMRIRHPELPGNRIFDAGMGLLGGLMTALLYALGVNILPVELPGGFSEVLTLVLSALGGWFFPVWLSRSRDG